MHKQLDLEKVRAFKTKGMQILSKIGIALDAIPVGALFSSLDH